MKDKGVTSKISSVCFILLLGIMILSLDCSSQQKAEPEGELVAIQISVVEGTVVCTPDPAHARFKDTVQWQCEYPFAVHFGKNTPFGKMGFKGNVETDKKAADVVVVSLMKNSHSISFKYIVAVVVDNDVLIADPQLIIDP